MHRSNWRTSVRHPSGGGGTAGTVEMADTSVAETSVEDAGKDGIHARATAAPASAPSIEPAMEVATPVVAGAVGAGAAAEGDAVWSWGAGCGALQTVGMRWSADVRFWRFPNPMCV